MLARGVTTWQFNDEVPPAAESPRHQGFAPEFVWPADVFDIASATRKVPISDKRECRRPQGHTQTKRKGGWRGPRAAGRVCRGGLTGLQLTTPPNKPHCRNAGGLRQLVANTTTWRPRSWFMYSARFSPQAVRFLFRCLVLMQPALPRWLFYTAARRVDYRYLPRLLLFSRRRRTTLYVGLYPCATYRTGGLSRLPPYRLASP